MKLNSLNTVPAAIILAATLSASMAGCAGGDEEPQQQTTTKTETVEQTESTKQETTSASVSESEKETETEDNTEAAEEDETEHEAQSESVSGVEGSIEAKLSDMTIEEKVAQMFAVMPDAISYTSPVTGGEQLRQGIYDYPVGGILFMSANLENSYQTKEMIENVQTYSADRIGLPMFTFVDEEGGSVRRISGRFSDVPQLESAASTSDADAAYRNGTIAGEYLSDLGFNVDFAPVADILSDASTSVMGDRAYGSDPGTVSELATSFGAGLSDKGVLATYKHFPGLGSTMTDTHTNSAYVDKSLGELDAWDLVPFQAAVDAGAEFIMVSHSTVTAMDGDGTPASMSKAVITGLLRNRMGYDGIVITDAMNMGAVAEYYSAANAAVSAVKAGADMVLAPSDFYSAYEAVVNAVESGEISETRIDESVGRILRVKEKIR